MEWQDKVTLKSVAKGIRLKFKKALEALQKANKGEDREVTGIRR